MKGGYLKKASGTKNTAILASWPLYALYSSITNFASLGDIFILSLIREPRVVDRFKGT